MKLQNGFFMALALCTLTFSSCQEDDGNNQAQVQVPPTPTGVTAAQSGSTIVVSWNEVSNAASYKVYRSSSSTGAYSLMSSTSSSHGTNYIDNSPLSGYNYYKVSAVNSAGESSQSIAAYVNYTSNSSGNEGGEDEEEKGSTTIPSVPTGVSATVNGTSVNISWNSVSGATAYFVYRSSSDGVPYTQIQSTSSTTATDASPLEGLNYYKVTAANAAGESDRSSFAYCEYEDNTPPATPTGVAVKYQNYYLVVSWNAVPGAARYAVWYKRPIAAGNYTEYAEDFMWVDAPSISVSFQWATMYLGTYTFWVEAANSNYDKSAASNKVTYNLNK
jgi:fibronectin type 3 domain-containing protein